VKPFPQPQHVGMKLCFLVAACAVFIGSSGGMVAAEAPPQILITAQLVDPKPNGDLLSAPRVTTLSGRQARVGMLSTVSLFGAEAKPAAPAGGSRGFVAGPIETGITLDLLPEWKEGMIECGGIVVVREFLGYEGGPAPRAALFAARELRFHCKAKSGELLAFKLGGEGKSKEMELRLTLTRVNPDGSPFAP
jgi:hypothetical protein